jgi:hypothetical protein
MSAEPKELALNNIAARSSKGWTVIGSLFLFHAAGAPKSMEALRDLGESVSLDAVRKADPNLTSDIASAYTAAETVRGPFLEQMAYVGARATFAVDAALIVFSHSVLDALVDELLQYLSDYARESWKKAVMKQEITLTVEDILTLNSEQVMNDEVANLRRKYQKGSLKAKANRVMQLSQVSNPPHFSDYVFNTEELGRVDELRNSLVHGTVLGNPVYDVLKSLTYMSSTAEYLIRTVAAATSVEIWVDLKTYMIPSSDRSSS